MDKIRFEWDRRKALVNKRKHGVSFKEARAVFADEYAMEYPDLDHSENEDRFIMLGLSARLRLLMVSYCRREAESVIRIISARKADKQEAENYRRE